MTDYIALVRKDPDSDFGVDFPDFPGCVSAGTSLDDARDMAAEALQFHIDGMIETGEAIPSPSSLDDVMADVHNRDAVVMLIPAVTPEPANVRVTLFVPRGIVEAIDRASADRSRFLVDAAEEKLRAAS